MARPLGRTRPRRTSKAVPTRGRVIAIDGDTAIVRAEQFDLRITNAARVWRPGDLVDIDRPAVLRAYGGGEYPAPGSEVMRLPRERIDLLRARATALAKVREVFAARGFLE